MTREVAPTEVRQEFNTTIAVFLIEVQDLPVSHYWHELFTKASVGSEEPSLNQELDFLFGDHLHKVLDRFVEKQNPCLPTVDNKVQ